MYTLKSIYIAALLLLLAAPVSAEYKFSKVQTDWLRIAFAEATKTGEPELVEVTQVVLFKETLAGKWGDNPLKIIGDKGTSFGPMQNQLRTTREVLALYPHLLDYLFLTKIPADEVLEKALLTHVEFNMAVGAHNLLRHWLKAGKEGLHGYERYARTVQAHNRGWVGATKVYRTKYLKVCDEYMKHAIRPFNRKFLPKAKIVSTF